MLPSNLQSFEFVHIERGAPPPTGGRRKPVHSPSLCGHTHPSEEVIQVASGRKRLVLAPPSAESEIRHSQGGRGAGAEVRSSNALSRTSTYRVVALRPQCVSTPCQRAQRGPLRAHHLLMGVLATNKHPFDAMPDGAAMPDGSEWDVTDGESEANELYCLWRCASMVHGDKARRIAARRRAAQDRRRARRADGGGGAGRRRGARRATPGRPAGGVQSGDARGRQVTPSAATSPSPEGRLSPALWCPPE